MIIVTIIKRGIYLRKMFGTHACNEMASIQSYLIESYWKLFIYHTYCDFRGCISAKQRTMTLNFFPYSKQNDY